MRYLVTGANGFVGPYLVKELKAAGHEVVGLVRTRGSLLKLEVSEVVADLLSPTEVAAAIRQAKPDGIFHLAAAETSVGKSWGHPAETIRDNLATTLNVLEAARQQDEPPRVLVVSSTEVAEAESPYAVSKQIGEEVARLYATQLKTPAIIARPSNHIGPGQREQFVVPGFAAQIAEIEKAGTGELKVGNLAARRDFSDVRDMVKAYLLLMEKGKPGETYPIGSGRIAAIQELLDFLVGQSTATIEVTVDQSRFRPVDTAAEPVDTNGITKLGWQPTISLEQTLSDMLAAARESHSN
jgi:GDP-4-dehydro-6-deoxy-D-mannose reductase